VELRPTTPDDLEFVMAAEADPEASSFVTVDSRELHEATIADPNQDHLIVTEGAESLGHVILRGIEDPNRVLEVRRIVIAEKGRGVGPVALRLAVDRCFREHGAHRVWLDVIPHNERALRVYRALGFVHEGVLREAQIVDGVHESLAIMSILEHEWDDAQG
jgi:RimJ/RimL family protein N-acetyltransferase